MERKQGTALYGGSSWQEVVTETWPPFTSIAVVPQSLRWDSMLSLYTGGRRAWSCPNLICQTLFTPHWSPYHLGGVDGR